MKTSIYTLRTENYTGEYLLKLIPSVTSQTMDNPETEGTTQILQFSINEAIPAKNQIIQLIQVNLDFLQDLLNRDYIGDDDYYDNIPAYFDQISQVITETKNYHEYNLDILKYYNTLIQKYNTLGDNELEILNY